MPQFHITKEKKIDLEKELHELKTIHRPDILKKVETARAFGDLKENSEYHSARDAQGKNEFRIREIQDILKYAVIVEKSSADTVGFSSTVIVHKDGDTDTKEFTLVGDAEADITAGKIGMSSPLGSALNGKMIGDTAQVETPRGVVEYKIVDIK